MLESGAAKTVISLETSFHPVDEPKGKMGDKLLLPGANGCWQFVSCPVQAGFHRAWRLLLVRREPVRVQPRSDRLIARKLWRSTKRDQVSSSRALQKRPSFKCVRAIFILPPIWSVTFPRAPASLNMGKSALQSLRDNLNIVSDGMQRSFSLWRWKTLKQRS